MVKSDAPEYLRHVKVRDVSWEEIVILDDRKYLEIANTNFVDTAQRLAALCECGAPLVFVGAEAWMNQPSTCCCGGCRKPELVVTGRCPGCFCDDCADRPPCALLGVVMGFSWEGQAELRLFFDPVPMEAS